MSVAKVERMDAECLALWRQIAVEGARGLLPYEYMKVKETPPLIAMLADGVVAAYQVRRAGADGSTSTEGGAQ